MVYTTNQKYGHLIHAHSIGIGKSPNPSLHNYIKHTIILTQFYNYIVKLEDLHIYIHADSDKSMKDGELPKLICAMRVTVALA